MCSNMDGLSIMASEISKTEKDLNTVSHSCGTYKVTQINVYTKHKQTHRNRKQPCSYQRVRGEGQIRVMDLTDTKYFT